MTSQSAYYSVLDVRRRQIVKRSLARILILSLLSLLLPVTSSSLALPFVPIQQSAQEAGNTEKDVRMLEQGKPIKRELTGGQEHSYRITLSADQFLKAAVEQGGIDAEVKLIGPDGERATDFDFESRMQGQEIVSWVAEKAGSYRLDVLAKYKNAGAGQYEIKVLELRPATENDRALHKARKLNTELASLFREGRYDEARPLVERMLEIRERVLGPEHIDVARALRYLALIHSFKSDYTRAELYWQRVLDIFEKTLGPEHPNVAKTLDNLATLNYERGDYEKAESLYSRALNILEKSLGPNHPNVAQTLNNFAYIYKNRGDLATTESFLQRALTIREKALEPDHPDVGYSLNNLATFYYERGDHLKAEPLYERALKIREKALGPEHPEVAMSLTNLAIIYNNKGDHAKAETLYGRALAILEKSLGPEHPRIAHPLNNLASIYYKKGDYERAEMLYRRALSAREKVLGPEHPNVAQALTLLANLYRRKGDYAKAEPLFQRAQAVNEKTLGPEHSQTAATLTFLAVLYAAKGDTAQAITFLSRANTVVERNFALNLAIGSERQKLAYLAGYSKQTDFTLSLHSQAAPDDPQALNLAFTTLLLRKGRGLDAVTDMIAIFRRHATPQDRELFDKLIDVRSQFAALKFKESNAADPNTNEERFKPLEEKIETLEGELSARSAGFRAQSQPVTLSAIQAALPAASTLVEFALYTPIEPRTDNDSPPRYLAYLLAPQGQPRWVDLGEAALIDRAVDAWRQALRGNRIDAKRLAREVDEMIMRPVRSSLQSGQSGPGEIRHLLIAPDGELNLIPFAALVDEQNRYLIERYNISYVTSGRDLLRLQDSPPNRNAPLVVADPLFGSVASATTQGAQRSGNSTARHRRESSSGQIVFRPLPGTKGEALAIKAVLPEASLLLQQEATEAALKRARAPRILHIATHGFFLSDQQAPTEEEGGALGNDPSLNSDLRLNKWAAYVEEPLLRSGLALSGANRNKDGDDDGVLTALEVAGLDLWGTKLVVLSACDTGVGEVKNGEGVQGLRRALVLAGSESQVMTLWPVTDQGAKKFMTEYYRALQRGEGRSEGLRQVQLRMLRSKQWRHPFYWAAFIQSGEWANLEGRR
jgi:CHAT domain-containing protein/Tfp pilus assembly protein PilF